MNETAPLLLLEDVSCQLQQQFVVNAVSFALQPGELACVLGPSGCGKTTLLRAIAGFQELAAGRIVLRGAEVATAKGGEAPEQRRVGLVFQDLALFPHLDVGANIAFGLAAAERGRDSVRVAEMLKLLGLVDLQKRFPHELSGGQQQRVALARTLAPRPDLVLLDEPFANLDARLRVRLRDELKRLLKAQGTSALLVTHDQDEAFAFADRIAVLHDGMLQQWATPFEIYHQPCNAFVAGFVGDGRLLPARVRDADSVDCELGSVRGQKPHGLAPGSAVQLLIRPDDILPASSSALTATVISAAFRGAETLYTLRLPTGGEVLALFPSHAQHAPGDQVAITPDIEHLVLFAEDAASDLGSGES